VLLSSADLHPTQKMSPLFAGCSLCSLACTAQASGAALRSKNLHYNKINAMSLFLKEQARNNCHYLSI